MDDDDDDGIKNGLIMELFPNKQYKNTVVRVKWKLAGVFFLIFI